MDNQSGIYCITNTSNGKRYVGSAVKLQQRRNEHWSRLGQGIHRNPHLQNAFKLYGITVFRFDVIEYCDKTQLIEREQFFIDTLHPEYNIMPKAGSNIGHRWTDEQKARLKVSRPNSSMKGKHLSEEAKAKISKANTGRVHTQEQKQKVSDKLKGRKMPASWFEKMKTRLQSGFAPSRGMKHTEEWKLENSKRTKETWARRRAEKSGIE
jgi:group I intron endonuclease